MTAYAKIVKNILMFPIYAGAIFTQAKSFKNNYIIGSRILNVCGLHVARVVLARGVWKLRKAIVWEMLKAKGEDLALLTLANRRFFEENGYLAIENFLQEDAFEQAEQQIRGWSGDVRVNVQGETLVYRKFLNKDGILEFDKCKNFTENKRLINLLKWCSAKNERPRFYIEQLRCGEGNDNPDPQGNMHSDCFHPTMKAWLMMEDVNEQNPPFCYVAGSNRLTWKRLKWEYKRSLVARVINDGYSEKGSFRAYEEDLKELGLAAEKKFYVKKNTLIVANTNGFHRRGEGQSGAKRLTLWATSRANPFNPWFGFGLRALEDLRDKVFVEYQKYQDNQAEKEGKRASWFIQKSKFD